MLRRVLFEDAFLRAQLAGYRSTRRASATG